MENQEKSIYLEGGKTGILLLHGFTGSPSELRETGEFLHKNGLTVSIPLLPGHGTTPEDLSTRKWQEWYECARENLKRLKRNCQSVFVGGLSFGGSLALYTSAHNQVSGVIGMAALTSIKYRWLFLVPFLSNFKKYKKKRNFDRSLQGRFTYDRYPLKAILEVDSFLDYLNHDLSKITSPLLLIYSLKDRSVSFDDSDTILNEVQSKQKELITLHNSHHILTMGPEKEKVNEVLLKFVSSST